MTFVALMGATTAQAEPFPASVTDDQGTEIILEARPERVAALMFAAADTLAALGRDVAGTTTFRGQRPEHLGDLIEGAADFGEFDSPNLELLATSDLDLIVGMTRYHSLYAEDFTEIAPFLSLDAFTLADSYRNTEQVAAAIGEAEAGAALNDAFRARLAEVGARAPGGTTVMMIWVFGDMIAAYHDNILPAQFFPLLGAENPLGVQEDAAPGDAFAVLEAEDVLAADPDVLLVYASHGGALAASPVFARLRAVQNGRVHAVGQHYIQSTGPIARRFLLEEVAHLLYPETFDPPSDLPEAARARPLDLNP